MTSIIVRRLFDIFFIFYFPVAGAKTLLIFIVYCPFIFVSVCFFRMMVFDLLQSRGPFILSNNVFIISARMLFFKCKRIGQWRSHYPILFAGFGHPGSPCVPVMSNTLISEGFYFPSILLHLVVSCNRMNSL